MPRNALGGRPTGSSIIMLIAGMGCFAGSDTIVKWLSPTFPAVQIAWTRYILLAVSILPFCSKEIFRQNRSAHAAQLGRGVCLMASALLLIAGLHHLPLAQATALAFASPLFVTLLSRVLLKENVDAVGWFLVGLGFVGVVVVMRPTAPEFTPVELLPVASSFAWALSVILTRKTVEQGASVTMLYSSVVGFVLLGAASVPTMSAVGGSEALLLVAMAILWVAAQWFVLIAYRQSQASRLAPFSYTQLLFATLLGGLVFDHWPDALSWSGIALIVGCGLVAAWRTSSFGETTK